MKTEFYDESGFPEYTTRSPDKNLDAPYKIGMKVVLGVDATAPDAIAEFRLRAAEQGFEWRRGSERAHFYEYKTKQIKGYEATDVRGGIFSLYVQRYEEVERTQYVGSVWSVIAEVGHEQS